MPKNRQSNGVAELKRTAHNIRCMEPITIFTGAFKVIRIDDAPTFRLEIWRKPGQIGHTPPDIIRTIKNGEAFEFTDHNGATEFTTEFRPYEN